MLDKLLVPSKRDFIKGLFVAPAVVAASNIMPVKAFKMAEAAAAAVSGGVIKTDDLNSFLGGQWALYKDGDQYMWMKPNVAGQFIRNLEEIKKVDLPDRLRVNQTMETVNLMNLSNAPVIWDLSSRFTRLRPLIGV